MSKERAAQLRSSPSLRGRRRSWARRRRRLRKAVLPAGVAAALPGLSVLRLRAVARRAGGRPWSARGPVK